MASNSGVLKHGDPSFFERLNTFSANIDAAHAADVAEHLGRRKDAWRWRTIAAQPGDTEAIRELGEGYPSVS